MWWSEPEPELAVPAFDELLALNWVRGGWVIPFAVGGGCFEPPIPLIDGCCVGTHGVKTSCLVTGRVLVKEL